MTLALYTPSPLWGEGRVRGPRVRGSRVRGPRQTGIVCESPRDYARGLRQTDAERRLWARLRDRRLAGAKFARQVPIGAYVVDFCCRELKVIVELDGGQHAVQVRSDTERTVFLEAQGYRVLRFWNNDVLGNTDGVLQRVAQALAARPSPRPSPRRGEGEGWE